MIFMWIVAVPFLLGGCATPDVADHSKHFTRPEIVDQTVPIEEKKTVDKEAADGAALDAKGWNTANNLLPAHSKYMREHGDDGSSSTPAKESDYSRATTAAGAAKMAEEMREYSNKLRERNQSGGESGSQSSSPSTSGSVTQVEDFFLQARGEMKAGNYKAAAATCRKALPIAAEALPEGHQMRVGLLATMAEAGALQGAWMDAVIYQTQAVQEAEKNPDFPADSLQAIKANKEEYERRLHQ